MQAFTFRHGGVEIGDREPSVEEFMANLAKQRQEEAAAKEKAAQEAAQLSTSSRSRNQRGSSSSSRNRGRKSS